MYKLVVIAGPSRGSSYPLQTGEMTLGRQSGNTVVLSSAKVSKRHCCITLSGNQVLIQDLGSSNGTFVNGVLIKSKALKAKDRVSVGEYVFELVEIVKKIQAVTPIQVQSLSLAQNNPSMLGMQTASSTALDHPNGPPKDFIGKVIWFFENKFMPFFYKLNSKHEWKIMGIYLFSGLIFASVIISIYPLLEENENSLIKEVGRRAQFMARQIAEKNAVFLASHAETKTEIGSVENAEGVRLALLIDLENRIIAPGEKLNQYLASGPEAKMAVKAKEKFQAGHETGFWSLVNDGILVAIEPVKVLSSSMGKNVIVAMAIVSLDTTLSTPALGEIGVVYSETLIIIGLLGAILFLIFYRLTLKPFEILHEDLDRVLKGDLSQVTHEFKFSELNVLWNVINTMVQRIPRESSHGNSLGGSNGGMALGEASTFSISDTLEIFKMLGDIIKFGLVIFDGEQKILYMNSVFEELSGIRSENALGQDMSSVARDQSLGAFTSDVLDRAMPGNEGFSEDYDFSGTAFKVYVAAVGKAGDSTKAGYLFAAVRNQEG